MDQERVGVKAIIGQTGDDLCPVKALLEYLHLRGCAPGALFLWQDGTPLSQPSFVTATRQALTAVNLPVQDFAGQLQDRGGHYSGHGWHRGFHHPDDGTVEECFLSSVHLTGSPAFGISFVDSVAASVASLTLYLPDSLGHTIQHHSITIIIGVVAAYTVRIFRSWFLLGMLSSSFDILRGNC